MSRSTILHIEDDANDVLLFQHACQKLNSGLELKAVCDGDEAICYLKGDQRFSDRHQNPMPLLVLLDLKMPRVNGFEVLSWMRSDTRFRRVPVIVLTSSNHDEDIKRAYDLGANSYLVKPVGFEALVDLAKSLESYWLKLNQHAGAERLEV